MFSSFFIKRPIFASVCALLILLLGAVSIPTLPIAQYPEIAPPQVTVTANYIGASASVVENTVTNIFRANLNQAEAAVAEAEANVEVSEDQLQDTNITAPFAGEVGNIIVKLGEYVAPGNPLTSVTENDPLELELAIPVQRRADLSTGLPVELEDTQGNTLGRGSITFVSPQVNANSQTILTQAQFPNPDGQLRDSQNVRARIIWSERSGVVVPTTAVTRVGGQAFVYVAQKAKNQGQTQNQAQNQPQLIARQVPVELGEIQNNSYPVLEGLQAGDRIVVSGILNLANGAPIKPQAQDLPQIQPGR